MLELERKDGLRFWDYKESYDMFNNNTEIK